MVEKSASEQIDDMVQLYGGWKGENITLLRALMKRVAPDIIEEVKWKMKTRPEGLPVWYHGGIVCLLETFKNDQKLVFTKGARMKDPNKQFNARLDSKTDRAIQLMEDTVIDEESVEQMVREALQLNAAKK